ncbi:hypothetical protein FAI41_03610 [Acetobacteraceae bacterium]|nr:hypothetical protein FAI41_03610 [Acetobacteraceae bacterium]
MTKTYAERKEVPVTKTTFDPVADPQNHSTATDEKDFGVRGIEDKLVEKSENPATEIPSRPLDR